METKLPGAKLMNAFTPTDEQLFKMEMLKSLSSLIEVFSQRFLIPEINRQVVATDGLNESQACDGHQIHKISRGHFSKKAWSAIQHIVITTLKKTKFRFFFGLDDPVENLVRIQNLIQSVDDQVIGAPASPFQAVTSDHPDEVVIDS